MTTVNIAEQKTDRGGYTHLRIPRPHNYDYRAGQYATLTFAPQDKPKFLALASHSDEADLFFLMGEAPESRQGIILSEPQGNGFQVDFNDKRPFLFLTHGTGISAIRPAMLERKKQQFRDDILLYGTRSAAEEPELDCLHPDFGIEQLRAFSKAEYKAYVQDHASTLDLAHFGAILLVGSSEMMVAVRELMAHKKFPSDRIFSNY